MAKNSSRRSATNPNPTVQRPGRLTGGLLGVAVVLFVAGSVVCGLFFLTKISDVLGLSGRFSPSSAEEKAAGADTGSVAGSSQPSPNGVPTKQASDPRYAFLLMGYGGAGHDGPYLTDSMIVVIVDPTNKSLTLLSLPRDAWVPLLFNGKTPVYNKINTAYAFAKDSSLYTDRLPRYKGSQGAGTFAMDTVARLLGIPISYYATLDFAGFRDMINTVGGIDINVPDGFTARYPANDNPSINPRWTVVRFTKGMQHMNGERAIEYARAREVLDNASEGSDFARSRRQRLIMEAFKARLFQPGGMIHIPQLLALGASHVDTNYPLPDAAQLGQFALEWRNVHFYQTALTIQNYLQEGTGPEGTYILVPASKGFSWAPIQSFARKLWNDPAAAVAMANTEIVVQNDTGVPGVAGQVSEWLAGMGYCVGTPVTGPVLTQSAVLDRTGNDSQALVKQLEGDLHVQLGSPKVEKASDTATLVLEVGSDDTGLSKLTLPAEGSAPSSAVGVVHAGSWSPVVAEQAPAPTARPSTPESVSHNLTPERPTPTAKTLAGTRVPTTATAHPYQPTLGTGAASTRTPLVSRLPAMPTPVTVEPRPGYPEATQPPQATP